MDLLSILYSFFKGSLAVLLLFFAVILYNFVYLPWRLRKKYINYPNVGMAGEYHLGLGDLALAQKNELENKHSMQHYIDAAKGEVDTVQLISLKSSLLKPMTSERNLYLQRWTEPIKLTLRQG